MHQTPKVMAAFNERYFKRIKHDLTELYADPVEGIYVVQDETHNNKVHALIIGPKDTPYDGGFFYFLFTYPDKYPLKPPAVKFMTTGDGKVRFNPNLYACGKVCLSILGTWTGPEWTSVMTTKSVLISIQSLIMNETPFFNEPGYESMRGKPEGKVKSDRYNAVISYEKLNVAVVEMIRSCQSEKFAMPSVLKEMAIKIFRDDYDRYQQMLDAITAEASTLRKTPCPKSKALLWGMSSRELADTDYSNLKTRLTALHSQLQSSKREDSFAAQLYDSLREAYTGIRSVKHEVEQMVEDIANDASSSSDEECVMIDNDSADDEVQIVDVVSPSKHSKEQSPQQD